MRARTIALGLAVLAGTAFGTGADVASAGGPPPDAGCNRANPAECRAGAGIPGTDTDRPIVDIDVDVDTGPNNICHNGLVGTWYRWDDLGTGWPAPDADEHPGETYWVLICGRADGQPWPTPLSAIDRAGWSGPAPPAAQPTPEQILPPLWAEVRNLLHDPALTVEPPGPRSIVGVPIFVQITNPQVPTRYRATAGSVTVWIDVDPTATLHAGEPGARARVCDADGTRYDPDGPPPRAQANAAGACAHMYRHRTDDDPGTTRPDHWTGDVTITWDVQWGANVAGSGGTLTAAPNVTEFDRAIDEVHSVVVDDG